MAAIHFLLTTNSCLVLANSCRGVLLIIQIRSIIRYIITENQSPAAIREYVERTFFFIEKMVVPFKRVPLKINPYQPHMHLIYWVFIGYIPFSPIFPRVFFPLFPESRVFWRKSRVFSLNFPMILWIRVFPGMHRTSIQVERLERLESPTVKMLSFIYLNPPRV